MRAAMVAAAMLGGAVLGGGAQAASLGRLTVLSGSGDPLRADIEITAIQPGEAESLRAALASADIYQQTQLTRPDFLSGVRVGVVDLPDGRKVVRVSSDAPLDARVVDLLVELNWATGRFIRQYSFFVDPPAQVRGAALASTIEVRRGDTAGAIARNLGYSDARLEQVLVALLDANPSAFVGGNVNRLRAGATLTVPDADTVRRVDAQAARRSLAAQQGEFERQRSGRGGSGAVVRRSGGGENAQQAAGTISATPTDQQAPAAAEGDRLRLSAAGPARPGTGGTAGAGASLQENADRMAEELAAKDKALQEAESRVKELERNVADMQRLLSVQNAALADAQSRANSAANAGNAAGAASTAPAAGDTGAQQAVPGVTPGASSTAPTTAGAGTPDAGTSVGLVPADGTTPAQGENWLTAQRAALIVAIVLVALLIALLIARRQRERRLNALAASAALAAAAAPSWAEPPARHDDDTHEADKVDEPTADMPPPPPLDFGFDLDLDKPAPALAARNADLDDDDMPPPLVKSSADVVAEPPVATPNVEPPPAATVVPPVVVPPVVVPPPAPAPAPAPESVVPPAGDDELETELTPPEPAPAPPSPTFAPLVTPEPGTSMDLVEDNASKLELAEAYLEIGDREGARELLEDVAKSGTAAQQARAKETLASLK